MLEALITMAILSVGLVTMAKFQGTLLQNSTLAKNRTIAINLAQDKIETLRSTDFVLLSGGSDIIDASIQQNISERYDRVWTVFSNGGNAAIEVTVEWGDYTAKGEVSRHTNIRLVSNISSSSATESGRLIDP